jgi:hypothetical protein
MPISSRFYKGPTDKLFSVSMPSEKPEDNLFIQVEMLIRKPAISLN